MKRIRFKAVYFLLAAAFITSMLTGCNKKEAVSTADFESLAVQRGYIIQEAEDYLNKYDYFLTATLAAPQNRAFQLEFYELKDTNFANSFYESNKSRLVMMKGAEAEEYTKSGNNFAIYKLEMYDRFMMIERVDNTVVYVGSTDASNRSEIEGFLKEISY